MRISRIFFLMTTLLAAFGTWGYGQSQQPAFLLSIKAERDNVPTGATVTLRATMTNNSNRTLTVQETSTAEDYVLNVRDATGARVSDTELGRTLKEGSKTPSQAHRNFVITLRPHETSEDTVAASIFCDMKRPGRYTIQVERRLPVELGFGWVKSNVITVTVTP